MHIEDHPRTTIEKLLQAQTVAEGLFKEIHTRGLLQPGVSELDLNAAIYGIAKERFGITKYWHKRIVRSGPNTLCPYKENPPNRIIGADDILFLDFGPVLDEWEADLGRTFVLGDDPRKHTLKRDTEECWRKGRELFAQNESLTGAELFRYVESLAVARGWQLGQEHCGHLIGEFPHEEIHGDSLDMYIHPLNTAPLRSSGTDAAPRHWILEVHLVDSQSDIGAFHEELLTM